MDRETIPAVGDEMGVDIESGTLCPFIPITDKGEYAHRVVRTSLGLRPEDERLCIDRDLTTSLPKRARLPRMTNQDDLPATTITRMVGGNPVSRRPTGFRQEDREWILAR